MIIYGTKFDNRVHIFFVGLAVFEHFPTYVWVLIQLVDVSENPAVDFSLGRILLPHGFQMIDLNVKLCFDTQEPLSFLGDFLVGVET